MNILVAPTNCTTVFMAFQFVDHKQATKWMATSYEVPNDLMIMVWEADAALRGLTDRDLETLCTGEHQERFTIAERSPELTLAASLLDLYINGTVIKRIVEDAPDA